MTHEACPRIEALSALVDDALAGPERAAIEAHAAICPVCGASLARLNELRAGFAALPAPRVGFDLAPAVAARIRAASGRRVRLRPARQAWWQGLPVALGTAAALAPVHTSACFSSAGGGVAAVRPAVEMSAFGTVPPGGLCLGPACDWRAMR